MQQDETYETIYQELQKKLPPSSPPPLPALAELDEQKSLSPHLLTIEGENHHDDDQGNNEVASSTSNDDSLSSASDDYDTDIETGTISQSFSSNKLRIFY